MTTSMRRALALVVAAVVVSACSAHDAPPRPSSSGAPPASPPASTVRADACFDLSLSEATLPTNADEPVLCTEPHTAQTIRIGRLPRKGDVDRFLAGTCQSSLARFVGGSVEDRRLSRFQVVWFSPTPEQAVVGDRWYRCDVLAVASGKRLLTLPRRLRGVLDRPKALASFGLCGTARPGSAGFERVACRLKHSWQAVATIALDGGRYPGVAAVRSAGDQQCADRVRALTGQPLKFRYGWEWPTKEQWSVGQHYGFCWAPV